MSMQLSKTGDGKIYLLGKRLVIQPDTQGKNPGGDFTIPTEKMVSFFRLAFSGTASRLEVNDGTVIGFEFIGSRKLQVHIFVSGHTGANFSVGSLIDLMFCVFRDRYHNIAEVKGLGGVLGLNLDAGQIEISPEMNSDFQYFLSPRNWKEFFDGVLFNTHWTYRSGVVDLKSSDLGYGIIAIDLHVSGTEAFMWRVVFKEVDLEQFRHQLNSATLGGGITF